MDYNILIAANTTEALEHLNNNRDIKIIFCDQRMPDKTGVEFFSEIRMEFPEPVRILLTGYADIEAVIDGINMGNIFRYVKKPWTDADIRSAITEANKFYLATSLLAMRNKELQTAYIELDKFSYSITHDMKRPLLSILGAIEVSKEINDPDVLKEMLNLMQDSVANLNDFMANMHDYYKVKRGELEIEEIDFNSILREQENTYGIVLKADNIGFSAEIEQQERFFSDKTSIRLILNNLISNAIKYQRKNNTDKKIELCIKISTGMATIQVTDNGIGIQEDYIPEIFNIFFRATTMEEGVGFGLYNVKDALLKLNGEIKVDSVLGQGTTFTVLIHNR